MNMRKRFSLMLALVFAVSSLGTSTMATEPQTSNKPISAIERDSGHFSTNVSAGKVMKIGSAISMQSGEIVNFNASYSPSDASVDFGLLDSNNVFYYINSTTGSINSGVDAPERGSYTPAIRNNSTKAIYVTGIIEC